MNRIFLLFILFASFGIRISYGWDLPLNVEVYELSFNHNTSSASEDGITLKTNSGGLIGAPEFSGGGTTNNKFAYLKTTSNPTVKAKFYTTESGISSLTIFVLPNGGDPTWYLSSEDVSFSSATSDLATYSSTGVSFTSMGTYFTDWVWRVSKVNGVQQTPTISIDGTYFDYYVVHQTPVSPMQEPWDWVLEKSCTWANGETTVPGCLTEITDGLYGYATYNSVTTDSNYYGSLDLTTLLSNFQSNDKRMDCHDFSNLINVLLAAQGISSGFRRHGSNISTYKILPAASGDWADCSFGCHQISWYASSYVIDASLKIDNDADPSQQPYTPKLPSGDIGFSDYRSKLTSGTPAFSESGSSSVY